MVGDGATFVVRERQDRGVGEALRDVGGTIFRRHQYTSGAAAMTQALARCLSVSNSPFWQKPMIQGPFAVTRQYWSASPYSWISHGPGEYAGEYAGPSLFGISITAPPLFGAFDGAQFGFAVLRRWHGQLHKG